MAVSTLRDLTICEAVSLLSSILEEQSIEGPYSSKLIICIMPKSRVCVCGVVLGGRNIIIYLNISTSNNEGGIQHYPLTAQLTENMMNVNDSIL